MRLAYLVSEYPAVSHTFIRREVQALRRRGMEIQTFSVRRPESVDALSIRDREELKRTWFIRERGVQSLFQAHILAIATRPLRYLRTLFEASRHCLPGVRGSLWALAYFAQAIVLARELERRRIQHLHNHFANAAATVGMLATRHLGITWSLGLHGNADLQYPAGALLGAKLRRASFASCASDFMRSQALRTIDVDRWTKIFVVRCGIELAAMPEPCPPNSRDPGPLRVLFVGRLSPEKGHLGLLDAFAATLERIGNIELVLVGDGPSRRLIERRIEELGLSKVCHLLGSLREEETLAEIARADVFALPSLMEGLPVVLMEAMALEVPVIAPHLAGIPELVEQGETGLLFAPARWDQLSEMLEKLITNPAERTRLARAARAKVLQEYEIDRATERLWQRFNALEENKPACSLRDALERA